MVDIGNNITSMFKWSSSHFPWTFLVRLCSIHMGKSETIIHRSAVLWYKFFGRTITNTGCRMVRSLNPISDFPLLVTLFKYRSLLFCWWMGLNPWKIRSLLGIIIIIIIFFIIFIIFIISLSQMPVREFHKWKQKPALLAQLLVSPTSWWVIPVVYCYRYPPVN